MVEDRGGFCSGLAPGCSLQVHSLVGEHPESQPQCWFRTLCAKTGRKSGIERRIFRTPCYFIDQMTGVSSFHSVSSRSVSPSQFLKLQRQQLSHLTSSSSSLCSSCPSLQPVSRLAAPRSPQTNLLPPPPPPAAATERKHPCCKTDNGRAQQG